MQLTEEHLMVMELFKLSRSCLQALFAACALMILVLMWSLQAARGAWLSYILVWWPGTLKSLKSSHPCTILNLIGCICTEELFWMQNAYHWMYRTEVLFWADASLWPVCWGVCVYKGLAGFLIKAQMLRWQRYEAKAYQYACQKLGNTNKGVSELALNSFWQ